MKWGWNSGEKLRKQWKVLPETGLCVASGLIFTYTPVFIEGNSHKSAVL